MAAGRAYSPREDLIERIVDRAHACGVEVTGAHLVCADGWGAYRAIARPLIRFERIAASAEVSADQHAGTALPRVAKAYRRRVATRLSSCERQLAGLRGAAPGGPEPTPDGPGDGAGGPAALDVVRLPEAWERVLTDEAGALDAADTALLALSFATPLLRDALLTQWSTDLDGGRTILAWQLAWRPDPSPGPPPSPPEGPLRMAGEGRRPDTERLVRGLDLARHVAASAPPRARAGSLAAAGWLAWALGNGTHAGAYADRAREIEPGHGLAGILVSLTDGGRLPGWVLDPPEDDDAAG